MRTTDELCELITSNPRIIAETDWADETDNFDISRMHELILGLNNIELIDDTAKMIALTWKKLESEDDPRCYTVTKSGETELKFPDRSNYLNEPVYIGIGPPFQVSTRSITGVLYCIKSEAIRKLHPKLEFEACQEELLEKYPAEGPQVKTMHENEEDLTQAATAHAEIQSEVEEWDNRYDKFLKDNLNAQAICDALRTINSPHLPKKERGYWWTFYRVLVELNWIHGTKGDKKILLQWANFHFNIGWDWSKDHLFKFGEVPGNEVISKQPIEKWNERNAKNIVGDYYGLLADEMIDAFQLFNDKGRNKDNQKFIMPGKHFINEGKTPYKRRQG